METELALNLALEVPKVIDVAHLALAGLSVVFLIVIFLRGSSNGVSQQGLNEQGGDVTVPPVDAQSAASGTVSTLREIDGDGAMQLLALFQSEGRLVDFIREDMAQHSDEDIGAAARVVHKGLRQAFDEHFDVAAIVSEEEGDAITVAEGFKPSEIQLLGQVTGQGPFKGTLVHQGWRVSDIRLPKVVEGRDSRILAPAQVEL